MIDKSKSLKTLIKTYTGESVYRQIGQSLVNGNYSDIQYYLTAILRDVDTIGTRLAYTQFNEPLYRGINKDAINLDDYKPFKVHFWPSFSSTSKKRDFALRRSRGKN